MGGPIEFVQMHFHLNFFAAMIWRGCVSRLKRVGSVHFLLIEIIIPVIGEEGAHFCVIAAFSHLIPRVSFFN